MLNFIRNPNYWMSVIAAVAASISASGAFAKTFGNHFVENMIFVRDSSNTLSHFGFRTFEQNGSVLIFDAIQSRAEIRQDLERQAEIEVDFKTEEDAMIVAELFSASNFEVGLSMSITHPLSTHMVFDASEVSFEDVDGMTNGGACSVRLSISEIVEWVKAHGNTGRF